MFINMRQLRDFVSCTRKGARKAAHENRWPTKTHNATVYKTNITMCLFITIFIRVDFSAIKIPIFSIKIDVVPTEKYPIPDLWLSSVGAHWHKLPICKIIRGAMERWSQWCLARLASDAAMAWCGCAQWGSCSGSYSPPQLTKLCITNKKSVY